MAFGAAVFFLFTLPWRSRFGEYLRFLALLLGSWILVTGWWLVRALPGFSGMRDTYQYHDSLMRPTFFAAWQSDTPLFGLRLPQFGEFGGLDTYTLLLIVALGIALIVAGRSRLIQLLACVFALAFLRKLQIAGAMRETGLVQLFPRANYVLALAALSMAVIGAALIGGRLSQWWAAREPKLSAPPGPVAVMMLGILLAIQGSVVYDYFMPNGDGRGALTLNAHQYGCWPIPDDADPDVPE
jgi:hypothetical protein